MSVFFLMYPIEKTKSELKSSSNILLRYSSEIQLDYHESFPSSATKIFNVFLDDINTKQIILKYS